MDLSKEEDSSGPSSLSSDQASLCVIPDPDDSSEEDGFIYLDKSSLPASLAEQDRTVIVFHSVDEEYPAHKDIVCQYIRPEGWEENSKDQVCLFKVGWVTKNDAVFMLSSPLPSNDPIGQIIIPESMLPKDTVNLYQFCYMRDYTLLGASTPFQFTLQNVRSSFSDAEEITHNEDPTEKKACICTEQKTKDNENLSGCPEITQNTAGVDQCCSAGKVEFVLQPCKEIPQLITAIYKDLELDHASENKSTTSIRDESFIDPEIGLSYSSAEVGLVSSQKSTLSNKRILLSNDGKDVIEPTDRHDDVSVLKQRFEEVNEQKKLFEKQYNALLITVNKYADDISMERTEKESLNGHMAELTISHKMLCSENTRLNNEVETLKLKLNDCAQKHEYQEEALKKQIQDLLADKTSFKREIDFLRSQIKEVNDVDQMHTECMCDKLKKQIKDLTVRLSDYQVMRNCLEVELEEEIKLGQERDRYLVQVEQVKVNNLQVANNWLASTPNTGTHGNILLEMEENVNSTLEALECALKEMEVLRSRKGAVNKANRVLREDFMQKRNEWEEQMTKERLEFDVKLADLQKQLECERSSKAALLKEMEYLTDQVHQQTLQQSQTRSQNEDVSEALQVAKREIESLQQQKSNLDKECSFLRLKAGSKGVDEDINSTLLKSLQEAREEYKKLYTEKIRIQEKLTRLQLKVKSKKLSRSHQEAAALDTANVDFLGNVSSSWRATIDELM